LLQLVEEAEKPRRAAGAHDQERFAELAREFLGQVHAAVAVDDRLQDHHVGALDRGAEAFRSSASDVPAVVLELMPGAPHEQIQLGLVSFDPADDSDVHADLLVMELSHDVRVAA
jgi:hypothetical protein